MSCSTTAFAKGRRAVPSPEQIKAAAISDATFDGWDDFEKLARWQRERYLDRSKRALEASEAAAPALLATALTQQEENERLRELLTECADDLESEIEGHYRDIKDHPAIAPKYHAYPV